MVHRLKTGLTPVNPYYKVLVFGFVCLVFYFIWMDIALYVHLQRWSPPPVLSNNATSNSLTTHQEIKVISQDPFSTFNPLTCKLVMVDHMTHYVHDILARFLVDYIGLAQLFPWVTANVVSISGVILAIVGSKFAASDSLFHRQMGALLFESRNLADSLDGVFARARKREQETVQVITYSSAYGTSGYNMDIICDVIGGAFFCLAIFYRFLRRKPQRKVNKMSIRVDMNRPDRNNNNEYKYAKIENISDQEMLSSAARESLESGDTAQPGAKRHVSSRQVQLIVIGFGLRILATGGLWDNFTHKYHDLLENYSNDPAQRHMQGQAFKSINMWLIMWCWRLVNGCALLEHIVFATIFDNLWDYIVFTTYIGWAFLGTLTLITQLHYTALASSLAV